MKPYGIQKRYKRTHTRYMDPQFRRWCNFKFYETKHKRDERLRQLQEEDTVFDYRPKGAMIH